jgi:hypothetical protein
LLAQVYPAGEHDLNDSLYRYLAVRSEPMSLAEGEPELGLSLPRFADLIWAGAESTGIPPP